MQNYIIQTMNQFGYVGIAFLIAIENIFPPIPSEVILAFGGFMTLTTNLSITGVIISATVGSVLGAIILYLIGRIFSKERLYRIVDGNIGKVLRFKKIDIDKSEKWFLKKGKSTVLFCRCIPIVRSLISIPAGITKMEFGTFVLYTTVGSLIWNTILTYLGAIAGNAWGKIVEYVDTFGKIILIILIVGLIGTICVFYKKRKNKF